MFDDGGGTGDRACGDRAGDRPATLERPLGKSRGLLGAQLDLYQNHSATLRSGVLGDRRALDRLAQLRREQIAVGLTLSGPRQAETLRRALDLRVDGAPFFDTVQATWNLLEPSAGAALAEAHAAGLGVIVKEALANGRLTPRNSAPAFAATRARLEREASRLATSIDGLAIAAALAQPWATVVLSGAASVEQLRSNLSALAVRWDPAAGAAVADLAEDTRAYWAVRSGLAWN